jgi:glycyl-tRNA synthetase beta chain
LSLDFLLEIGTEEIPHWMIPSALAQLQKLDLLGATPRVEATPRRLVVQASCVPQGTPNREDVLLGPAPGPGTTTAVPVMDRATEGWIRKNKLEITDIYLHPTDKGLRWAVTRSIPGRSAAELLTDTLPSAILGLQWPKTMYWTGGKTGPRFIRPIRWIVALLGDQVIPFEIAGVRSTSITRGHRILGSSSIPVTTTNYEAELRKNFVILSSHERRHKIETEASKLGAKIDTDLLETLTFITEYPTAIRGDFDPLYLELPAEVLTTVMRHHQ